MDEPLKVAPASIVRALIANRYLFVETAASEVGSIRLRPHQTEAVGRLRKILKARRCALLADDVGLGKTYVAAALATDSQHTLLIAPAGLCEMWREALCQAGANLIEIVSHESMSRNPGLDLDYDLVIVDEAHHLRNPATKRYDHVADVTCDAQLLLLSATPVHNSERDLRSLFALAWGSRAWTMGLDEILCAVIRRQHSAVDGAMPTADPAVWLPLPDDARTLESILSLPPALPPREGGQADALVIHGLARQWASSDYTLSRALTRRRAHGLALISALEQGRYPSRAELRSWAHAEDSLQLGFPELLASPHPDASALLQVVKVHEAAIAELAGSVRDRRTADCARAGHLLKLRANHPGARIVAFTQFADTAKGLYQLLVSSGRVAMLTARGATTAGGMMTRREALGRFSPSRAPHMKVPPAEEIDLLLTTDLLSEGVDLPDVSVVVHLDLPWTPARLEQRVGRALRLTSLHRRVAVYCMSPPASSEALVRSEAILRRKLQESARTVGIAGTILPAVSSTRPDASPPSEIGEAIRRVLQQWRTEPDVESGNVMLASSAYADLKGWIAIVEHGEEVSLVVARDGSIVERDEDRLTILQQANGAEARVDPDTVEAALNLLSDWVHHHAGADDAALSIAPGARSGTRLLRRIGTITRRAPAHRRTVIAELAIHARRAVLARRGISGERVLATFADMRLPDEAWLVALGTFGHMNDATNQNEDRPHSARVVALLLLQRG